MKKGPKRLRMRDLRPGDEVFHASWGFLDNKVEVHRQFILACSPEDGFRVGESRRMESMISTSPWRPDEEVPYFRTPEEAAADHVDWEIELAQDEIERLEKQQADLRKRISEMRKMDPKRHKIRKYDEDWTPCDW